MRKSIIKYLPFLLLALIVLLSYGQTLNMYFWVDDWGMAYKMQHPEANIPNFGPGIFGDGAYRYNVTPFIMLYPLFGLNAFPYFLIGIIFYFLATLVVYLLAKEIFEKKSIGLVSAAIFASGYIGSDAMNHLNNSYMLVLTGTFSALTAWLIIKYYQTGLKNYYFLSILIFLIILEFLVLRAHGLFLLVFSVSLLAKIIYQKSLLHVLIRTVPYLVIWIYVFFLDPRMSKEYNGVGRGDLLPNTLNLFFKEKHFELFNNLIITMSDVIFPDEILLSLYRYLVPKVNNQDLLLSLPTLSVAMIITYIYWKLKLPLRSIVISGLILGAYLVYVLLSFHQSSAVWNPDPSRLFISSWFGSMLCLIGFLSFNRKLKQKLYLVFFGLAWVISNVLIYFIYNPTSNLESNMRYLIPGFIGTCLMLGGILNLFSKRYYFWLLIFVLIYCSSLIFLNISRAKYIVDSVSIPTKENLQTIKNTVSTMNKNTVFYFETATESKSRISDLGGMPNLAIPVVLNSHGFANIAVSYDELFYLLKENIVDFDNVHTFFGQYEYIVNTTQEFRRLLLEAAEEKNISSWKINTGNSQTNCCRTESILWISKQGSVSVNPIIEMDVDYPSLVPIELTLRMKIDPVRGDFNFPFVDKTEYYLETFDKKILANEIISPIGQVSFEEQEAYFKSELERQANNSTTSVSSNSSEKTRKPEFVLDDKTSTGWEANSKDWRVDKKTIDFQFNFDNEKTFSNFVWINNNPSSTPTEYSLFISEDGNSWQVIKHLRDSVKMSGEITVNSFNAVRAKYFKMAIRRTYGDTSAPGISEAWVGTVMPVTDLEKRALFNSCVLCLVKNNDEVREISRSYQKVAQARVSWLSNRNTNYSQDDFNKFHIFMDGKYHTYKIYIPAQGTKLRKIKLDDFIFPVEILIESATIKSLNLDEMVSKNLIHNFAN